MLALLFFETPGYLFLLAAIPLMVVLSFRSLSGLGALRRAIAIGLRCAVVLVIVLALAGAHSTRRLDSLTVVFLVDRSRSIPSDLQRAAFDYLRRIDMQGHPDDRIGVIGFDGVAGIEQLPMGTLAIDQLGAPVDPDRTDLSAAVRLAAALLPADSAGRIVLISDGNQNVGDVLQEAERLRAARIPLDILPVQYEHESEIVFESLKAPPTASTDETVNLQMVLRSQQLATGKILLWHNEQLVDLNGDEEGAGFAVELQPGPNRFVRQVSLRAAGAHRFRAQFIPDRPEYDAIADNNTGQAFTVVAGQGRALILTTDEDLREAQPSAEILRRALEAEKLSCDVAIAGQSMLDQVHLLEYPLVILSNVPAGELSEEEKKSLAIYVRDLGGGLVMIGGDNSFGAGGWLGSPVEEVMPVSFEVKHKKQVIKGGLVLVMHACEIPQGNYIGERCAIEAVKTLSSRDLVGVLAWKWLGTDRGNWVVPLQEVGARTPILSAIKTMSMGDLPDLDEVMRPGVEALLARKDLGPKHMVVISDFDPAAPRQDLIDTMRQHGITCSTIGIGYGGHFIDEKTATWIAESTGGRFYRGHDYNKLPQIFIKESREIRRSLVQEVPFTPRLVNPLSPVIPGLTDERLPELLGLVLTTAKPLADVPLVRKSEEGDDPLLAHWQVGLGKTVAFTSGMWSRWGAHWLGWPRFTKLWAQVVRWASRAADSAALDVATTVHGGKAKVQIDALDKNADAINFLEIGGTLVTPGQESQPLRLTQTGPGRYEAEFDVQDRGNYIVNLAYTMGPGREVSSGTLRTGISIAYSQEYAQARTNMPLLEELRRRTGGRMLTADDPQAVLDRGGLARAEVRQAIWELLVRWLLVLFLLDVAVRRIAIHPGELYRKARQFLAEVAGRGRSAEAAAVLTTLKVARQRQRAESVAGHPLRAAGSEAPATKASEPGRARPAGADDRAAEDLARALGGAAEQDAPVVAPPAGPKPAPSEADYTARLLRAKRRARDDLGERSQ